MCNPHSQIICSILTETSEYVEIWLNAEVFDAFKATQRGIGFKIYIHEQDMVPIDSDHFFFVAPGYNYDVTLFKGMWVVLYLIISNE